jgi:hypothetical protein
VSVQGVYRTACTEPQCLYRGCTVRPVQNLIVCTRVHFTSFYHRRTDGDPVRTRKWSVEYETKSGEILSSWATVSFFKKDFAVWNQLFEVMLIDNSHFVRISEKWKITFAPFMLRYLCLNCNMFTLTLMFVSTCNYVCLRKCVAMHSYGYEKIMDHCKRKRQEKEEFLGPENWGLSEYSALICRIGVVGYYECKLSKSRPFISIFPPFRCTYSAINSDVRSCVLSAGENRIRDR